jgi:hypothetical protein
MIKACKYAMHKKGRVSPLLLPEFKETTAGKLDGKRGVKHGSLIL